MSQTHRSECHFPPEVVQLLPQRLPYFLKLEELYVYVTPKGAGILVKHLGVSEDNELGQEVRVFLSVGRFEMSNGNGKATKIHDHTRLYCNTHYRGWCEASELPPSEAGTGDVTVLAEGSLLLYSGSNP